MSKLEILRREGKRAYPPRRSESVSYTHLDVYKRQPLRRSKEPAHDRECGRLALSLIHI